MGASTTNQLCVVLGVPWVCGKPLTGAKRRENDGLLGVAGIIIDTYCGSLPHSLLSTSKTNLGLIVKSL